MICSASPSYGNTTRTRNSLSPFITSAYRIVLHGIANLLRFIAYIIVIVHRPYR